MFHDGMSQFERDVDEYLTLSIEGRETAPSQLG